MSLKEQLLEGMLLHLSYAHLGVSYPRITCTLCFLQIILLGSQWLPLLKKFFNGNIANM